MPDRVLRDEILESDRWLGLPSDTDRLTYIGLLLRCDDFGNLEGGLRRVSRFFQSFSSVKTDETAAAILLHLTDADMVRRYQVEGREFYHLPRFRTSASYLVRKVPPSPWCNPAALLGKNVRIVKNQGLAKNLPVTLPKSPSDVFAGVGVGVGVGVGEKPKPKSKPNPSVAALFPAALPVSHELWTHFRDVRKKLKAPGTQYAEQLLATKLGKLAKAGHDPVKVVEQSIERGWKGLFPIEAEKSHKQTQFDARAEVARAIFGESNDEPTDITGTADRLD